MLQIAREYRGKIEAYRRAFSAIDESEWHEVGYRTVHGSFKSIAYGRDLLARYLGYLAYFVPGIDFDGLVPPVPPDARLRYLHYSSPLELVYASHCLQAFGCNGDIFKPLREILEWRFMGQSTIELTRMAMLVSGVAATFVIIAKHHTRAIAWLLDRRSIELLDGDPPRNVRRVLQTFRDFWDLGEVLNPDEPTGLRGILKEFHENASTKVDLKPVPVPTFAQFFNSTTTHQ